MTFAWPHLLWLLLIPAALLAWELTRRRSVAGSEAHPKIARAEAGIHRVSLIGDASTLPTQAGARPWLAAGLALAILALARPQWGRLEQPVFEQSREILLAIDLSRSMLAPDVKPSRLDRAKLLIQSLLEKLAGERVGLVVFSGTAFLQAPLSADYEILREFLPALDPDFLPEGGTNYTALLRTAIEGFGAATAADRFLIILSDGEATDEGWRAQLDPLQKKSIRVIGLGVGTGAGAMIPDGEGGFVKDERGAVVLSRLEAGTLQELARATGGVYRDASGWVDLAEVLRDTVEAGRKGEFVETNTVWLVERFQWPLALALWCLLVSLCYEVPVRPRPRTIALHTGTRGAREKDGMKTKAASAPAVASALLALMAAVLVATPPAHAAARLAEPKAEVAAPEPSLLAKIVGRLAAAQKHSARDWAELGRETVLWGSRLKSEQQPVPEGPVRDALAAVDLGAKLDAKATDWTRLKQELEALLEPPPEEEQPQDQDQPQPDPNQQDQDQQSQDQNQPGQQQDGGDPQQNQGQPENPEDRAGEQRQPGESAFGDMNEKAEPPPPSSDTQRVGGAQEKDTPQEARDPSLTLPLQKLDQLRDQDSPAQLFQLMEPDERPAKKPGKNW
jgi:Ca-activated chloride channel homolog